MGASPEPDTGPGRQPLDLAVTIVADDEPSLAYDLLWRKLLSAPDAPLDSDPEPEPPKPPARRPRPCPASSKETA
jgi:hypothetical protein